MNNADTPSDTAMLAPAGVASSASLPRYVWAVGGALGLMVVGLASALAMRVTPPAAAEAAPATAAQAVVQGPANNHASHAVPSSTPNNAPNTTSAPAAPLDTRPVQACSNCGVVESVSSFERKGEGTGVGAVGGAVVGGLLGHQVGGGNGKTAMTVLGAVGGGFAGHEVEKRVRSETYYSVKVRMNDGSLRTVTQKTPTAVGSRVVVEGKTLRTVNAEQAPRTTRTSDGGLGT